MISGIAFILNRFRLELLLFLLSFIVIGCAEKINPPEENLGDGILDKIDVEFDDDYNKVEFLYAWDDLGRLSSISYLNRWIDDGGSLEITYSNDNEMNVTYQFGANDSWGTYRIFYQSGMVDSIFFDGGTIAGEPSTYTRYFDHRADSILQFTTTNWLYSESVSTDTAIWYLDEKGLIRSFQNNVIEEFTFDNKENPLAMSFVQFSPMYLGNWIMPILVSSNRTLRMITDRNIETSASYEYFSNDLPREAIIGDWKYQYSY